MAAQRTDVCVYKDEDVTIPLFVLDENDDLIDLTSHRILMVVWDPSTGVTSFTKDSDIGPAEITILDQVANKGEAEIYILPANLAAVGLLKYNIWLDLPGGDQKMIMPESRFDIFNSKRS